MTSKPTTLWSDIDFERDGKQIDWLLSAALGDAIGLWLSMHHSDLRWSSGGRGRRSC